MQKKVFLEQEQKSLIIYKKRAKESFFSMLEQQQNLKAKQIASTERIWYFSPRKWLFQKN